MNANKQSFAGWMFRKFAAIWIFSAIVGLTIGFIHAKSPDTSRVLEVICGLLFSAVFLIYCYFTFRPNKENQYQWNQIDRIGISSSAVGALLISFRLLAGSEAGRLWIYAMVAFSLAFIVRPIFEAIGWKRRSEQVGVRQ